MKVNAQVLYDSENDRLIFRVPAAEGDGDVELLRLDVRQLPDEAKQRLRHVRDPEQVQPEPGSGQATRPAG